MKNIANILSISRIFLALSLFFFIKNETGFLIMYSICWFTDAIDGSIARATGSESELGSKVDDIGDYTLIVIMIIIMIIWIKSLVIPLLPFLGALIIIRVGNIILTRIKFGKLCIIHTYLNKFTAMLAFALPVTYILFDTLFFAYAVLIVGIIASLEESIIHLSSEEHNRHRRTLVRRADPIVTQES